MSHRGLLISAVLLRRLLTLGSAGCCRQVGVVGLLKFMLGKDTKLHMQHNADIQGEQGQVAACLGS